MERYSLIVVSDETKPIRRFDVPRTKVHRAVVGGVVGAVLLLALLVDYVRVRIDQVELGSLRVQAAEQEAKIASFDETVLDVQAALQQVRDFERKVRIIANLPGSAASGGAEVTEVGPGGNEMLPGGEGGEEAELVPTGPQAAPSDEGSARRAATRATAGSFDDRVSRLTQAALKLQLAAEQRHLSLGELIAQLEDKHAKLASSPAIWPTQGWLTSRFGTRISPFTGKRQFHAGIDIAGANGTDVVATASGKVTFSGKKGPLGSTVIIDHGHGIRTHYGHNQDVLVKRGEKVERGQVIASLGNTGRSTGPHLHYTVEVRGKAVNPLDYIFD